MASSTNRAPPAGQFARRVLIVVAILALGAFLWLSRDALLLAFASIVLALLLSEIAAPLQEHLGVPRRGALLTAGIGMLAIAAILFVLIGAEAFAQLRDLGERLPRALRSLENRFGIEVVEGGSDGLASAARDFLRQAVSWGPALLSALSSLVLVVIGSAFLVSNPDVYRLGLVKLFPPDMHERVGETVDIAGAALSRWLLAQLLAMAMVGTLVALGAWAIGLPSPLALGLFAAMVEFVPIVGPMVGAVPALLLALSQDGSALLWTAALFLAIQQLESNVLSPILTRRIARIPPAVLLFSVVAFGLVFGVMGVILAAPLTMLAYVAVTKLWVRETLKEPAEVPGEDDATAERAEAERAEQAAEERS